MATQQITEEQLHAFGNKLEAFGNSLPPLEQALLAEILSLAATATEDDVTGHSLMASVLSSVNFADIHMYIHALTLHFSHFSHAASLATSHAAHISSNIADSKISNSRPG